MVQKPYNKFIGIVLIAMFLFATIPTGAATSHYYYSSRNLAYYGALTDASFCILRNGGNPAATGIFESAEKYFEVFCVDGYEGLHHYDNSNNIEDPDAEHQYDANGYAFYIVAGITVVIIIVAGKIITSGGGSGGIGSGGCDIVGRIVGAPVMFC